jgi:hypothetical protein
MFVFQPMKVKYNVGYGRPGINILALARSKFGDDEQ